MGWSWRFTIHYNPGENIMAEQFLPHNKWFFATYFVQDSSFDRWQIYLGWLLFIQLWGVKLVYFGRKLLLWCATSSLLLEYGLALNFELFESSLFEWNDLGLGILGAGIDWVIRFFYFHKLETSVTVSILVKLFWMDFRSRMWINGMVLTFYYPLQSRRKHNGRTVFATQ